MRATGWMLMAALLPAPATAQRIFADGLETPYGFDFARLGSGVLGAGSDVALSWDAPGADECLASGVGPGTSFPFSGTRAPTVAAEVVRLAQAGLYRFVLICRRGTESAARLVDVVVDAQPAGAPLPLLDLLRSTVEAGEHNSGHARLATGSPAGQCEATHVGPGVTAWPGAIAGGTQRETTATASGLHAFGLTCSNQAGSATLVRHVLVTEPQGCSAPGIRPEGWLASDRSWQQAFSSPDGSPVASWPYSVYFPVPLRAARGGWTSVGFVAQGDVTGLQLWWQRAEAIPSQGYATPSPALGMFVAISPCRGDTRPPDPASPDPSLSAHCRKFSYVSALIFSWATTNAPVCVLVPGRRYYYTFLAADPRDGLVPGESTCEAGATGCEVVGRQAPPVY